MTVLVTGSAGHLGEALVRVLRAQGHSVVGVDLRPSPFTTALGSVADRAFVKRCVAGADAIIHTAALHKPHIVTHSRQDFVDANITGTLTLLEEAVAVGVGVFVFTSTTSVYGHANASSGTGKAAWITEDVVPRPRNVYGITKIAAEDFCELFHRKFRLPCVILRTSRFFADADDNEGVRAAYADANVKVNEYVYRRADLDDVVSAHLRALECGRDIAFGRYIISATTPFAMADCAELATDAPGVLMRYAPGYADVYARLGWSMFTTLDRVYVNGRARADLGWNPRYDFARVLELVAAGQEYCSTLAATVGFKGYHDEAFASRVYPVE